MTFRVYLSDQDNYCLSFRLPNEEKCWIGYRLVEGMPLIADSIKGAYSEHPVAATPKPHNKQIALSPSDEDFVRELGWSLYQDLTSESSAPRLRFSSDRDGSANCTVVDEDEGLQLTWHLAPTEDGIWLELHISSDVFVPAGYCVQQCLRFTGAWNDPWRHGVAHVPFLSELDMQAMGNANGTLTYAIRDGELFSFPLGQTIAPTKGVKFGDVPGDFSVDHGLIARQTADRQRAPKWYWDRVAPGSTWESISSGMYWERTALVSNRHPADCVHSWVDIGPIDPGETRVIRGRFYYLEGSVEDLLALFNDQFSVAS